MIRRATNANINKLLRYGKTSYKGKLKQVTKVW
jgi:hypothetical protein